MKRIILSTTIALVALLTCALSASAATTTFSKDGIYYQLTTYSDGSGVLTVQNNGSFNTYSGVVNIPDSVQYENVLYPVTGIGYQAFKNCTGLTAVTIPEGVTMLLNESFAGCTSLTSITLPSTMVSIYNSAFVGCTHLTSITCLRETAKSFSSNNFDASTYANATLYVPMGSKSSYQSVEAWSLFANIQEINKFVVDHIYYTVTGGQNVSVTYRDGSYGSYCGEIVVPATVTYRGVTYNVTGVGESAFRGCNYSDRALFVTLPNSVTTIGAYGFYGSNLYFIEMGTRVASIGEHAFEGTEGSLLFVICHSMSTPSIKTNTFAQQTYENAYLFIPRMAYGRYTSANHWSNFNSDNIFYVYDFVVDGIYYGINSYVNTVEVSAYAISPDFGSFYGTYGVKDSVVIPPVVTYEGTQYTVNGIGVGAFYDWEVNDVSLPSTIQSIGRSAFSNCGSLSQIHFSEGLTRIDQTAFLYCTDLQRVDIPSSVKFIGYGAFYGCYGLQQVGIGVGVEDIGDYAFGDCGNLYTVLSYSLIPPVTSDNAFTEQTYNFGTLYAPLSVVPAYEAAFGWRNFYQVTGMHTLDEALNAPGGNIHFEDVDDYHWVVLTDGERLYAQSGNAGVHESSSTIETTVKVTEASVLSFDFKAWGESSPDNPNTTYDECVFMVNGSSIFRYGARDNDWETFSYDLKPNVTYKLRWYYHKDVSINPSGDYFALDNIKIAPKAIRGDVNGDNDVTIADVSALIDYLLTGDATDISLTAANCNGDDDVSIADVSALIDYLLTGSW